LSLWQRQETPLYEGGDASSDAIEKAANSIRRLGERIQFVLKPNADLLRDGLKACLEAPRVEPPGPVGD